MMLTIFTPTYNRVDLLPRLYQSLIEQTERDFEWLIIDDGSTDKTEEYVNSIIKEKKIHIRYYWQKNSGKQSAHNNAVGLARGEWFFCVDSDDFLESTAVEKIKNRLGWLERNDCGLIAGKIDTRGVPLCKGLEENLAHRGLYSLNRLYGVQGEVSLIFKTEPLKENLYPIISGERFIGECVLYDALEMKGYTLCPLPENITICEYQSDGLSNSAYQIMMYNPGGYAYYHMQRIDLVLSVKERIRHAVQYQAFRALSDDKACCYCGTHMWCSRLAYLPGMMGAIYYKMKFKHKRNGESG
ncbi:glycosyltransferase family 2 protein [Flavonifractor sp. An4]|uniref:glycosyltransferase family 2 protein n=1 Tax=Flavonifractor sp. An4 TaxID=1965634 RepID=UPI000B369442|nr:glycosyltransferase family A protein [Flavonifractor sp. An4]OUO14918.1 hypothetical protein B5F94_07930 [Flavonifractor sp. An4]